MAFKMNGSPMHSGTDSHKSALKMAKKSPAKDKKIIDGTADAPRHNAYLATESHYGDPHGPKPSDKPEEVKEAAESGALKMKSPTKQTWPGEGVKPRPQTKKDKKADKKLIKKANKIFSGKQEDIKKQSKKRIKDFDKKSKDPNYTWGKKK